MIIKFKLTNPRTEYINIACLYYESYQMFIAKNRYPECNGDVMDINIVTSGTTQFNMPGFKTEDEAQYILDTIVKRLMNTSVSPSDVPWFDVDFELASYRELKGKGERQ